MMRFFVLLLLTAIPLSLLAQDTLPRFTVVTRGNNKVLISWTNAYRSVAQISIQRSLDSIRNFKTILTVPDPRNSQNGFVDAKATTSSMFYRLFIVLDSGKYQFTRSARPKFDTSRLETAIVPAGKVNGNKRVVISENMSNSDIQELKEKLEPAPVAAPEKFFLISKRDTIVARISEDRLKSYRDSIVNKTKDTLIFASVDTILIRPFIPREVYKASKYVFTEKDGNVTIVLPDAGKKNYSVKFFEDDLRALFEIKKISQPFLTLDKSNFLHSGWFRFELFEDGNLKERHRLYVPRDF